MNSPSSDQPRQAALEEVFGELRAGYDHLESYVEQTFGRLIALEGELATAEPTSDDTAEWTDQKETLESELNALRAAKEELAATLSAKEQELNEQQAKWDHELDGLRKLVERKMAENTSIAGGSDPVVNSVMQTFANLKK